MEETTKQDNEGNELVDTSSEKSGLYNPVDESPSSRLGGAKNLFWGTRNRKIATTGTGIGGGVIGAILFIIFFAAGPAQLIQLSSILQKNFTGMDQASSNRLDAEVSDSTSSLSGAPADLGATRLGNLSQIYLGYLRKQWSGAGIEPINNSTHGISGYTIDPEEFAAKNPDFPISSSIEAQKAWLADQFSDVDGLVIGQQGKLFTLTDSSNPIELMRGTTRLVNSIISDLLGDNDIIGALNSRVISVSEGAPSLFHPLKAITEAARRKTTISSSQLKEEEDNEQAQDVSADLVGADDSAATVASLRATLNGAFESSIGKSLASVLIAQAVYCEMYGQVGNIVSFNRDAISLPAAVEAFRFIAIGDQIKSGQDVSSQEVGNVVDSLSNSQGQTVWQAKSLQVEENVSNPSGPDLPSDYYQAFSGTTTANAIEGALSSHGISGLTCNPIAEAANAFIGLAALVAAFPTDGTSLAAYLGARAGAAAGLGFALYFVSHDILAGLLKDNAIVPAVLSGPLGGNLLAYGARESSNIVARSEGGIALSNSQSTQLTDAEQNQSNKQFASESLFSRIFNIDDNRTILGKIADSVSPNILTDLATLAHSLLNIEQIVPKILSIFIPKASAAATSYNWGFPQYGIPSSILDSTDPTMENPYVNASMVVPLLQDNTSNITQRVQDCFGDQITDSSGLWDVLPIPNYDVNPNGQTYENANCSDTINTWNGITGQDWQRIILFVLDTRTMQSAACYDGDAQSCSDIGFNNANT